jgi:vitamin B12 transporter
MRISFVLACLFLIGYNPSFAQVELDEVEVTGKLSGRKSISTLNTAGTYISDSVIKSNLHLSLPQLLSQQTGVVINGATQTSGSVQTVYFRGATRGLVLILLNGIPVSDGSDIDQTFDLNNISLSQVDRIEIMRGGQSVVYGSDAVGGVINIITRVSPNKPISVTANASYGSFNNLRAGINLAGTQNGFTYQAAYNKQSVGGISAAAIPATSSVSEFEKDGFNRDALNFDLRKTIGKSISLYSNLRYATYRADLDASAFTDDRDNTAESNNLQIGFGGDYTFDKGLVNLSYNRINTNRTYEDDSTDVPASAFSKYSYSTFGSANDFLEVYTNLNLSSNFNLLIGVDYQRIATSQTYRSVSSFGEFVSLPLTDDLSNLTNFSGYFTANYKVNNVGIEVGSRLNQNSIYGTNYSYSVNPYFSKGGFKVFGVFAKSYKNPSLYQVFSEYGNKELQPQEALTLDLGFEYKLSNSLDFATTFFARNTQNLFFFNSTNVAPFGQYINLDEQTENGLEIELKKRFEKLQVYGNVTHILSAKTIIDATDETTDNNNFLRRPRTVLNAGLTFSPIQKLTLNGNIQYQSKRQDRFFNSETFASETIDLKAFTLLNLVTSYSVSKNLNVGLTINNLLNQSYFEVYGYNSLPRNFSINALVRF